jgi:hypothetical protein
MTVADTARPGDWSAVSRPLRRSESRDSARKSATARWPCGEDARARPAACRRSQRSPPLASVCVLRREQVRICQGRRVPAGRRGASRAAPGRPQVRPASVPEVTVGGDGVVVVLVPSPREGAHSARCRQTPARVRWIPSSASRSVHPNIIWKP